MGKYHIFSDSEKEFLRENIGNYTYAELTKAFNDKFGTNLNQHSISDICTKRLKIKRNRNAGHFKAGKKAALEVGAEVEKGGYLWVKYADHYHEGKCDFNKYRENWIEKHRYIYESHYGKIKDKHIVIFLDGNKRNFDITNLYCISRSVHAVMCKNNWFKDDPVATLTAIKWCELYFTIQARMEELDSPRRDRYETDRCK